MTSSEKVNKEGCTLSRSRWRCLKMQSERLFSLTASPVTYIMWPKKRCHNSTRSRIKTLILWPPFAGCVLSTTTLGTTIWHTFMTYKSIESWTFGWIICSAYQELSSSFTPVALCPCSDLQQCQLPQMSLSVPFIKLGCCWLGVCGEMPAWHHPAFLNFSWLLPVLRIRPSR